MAIIQKVCIITEAHSLQEVSRNQRTLVFLFLFVKQRQEGNGWVFFSPLKHPTSTGTHVASYSMGTGNSLEGG